jgi:endonuclease/exonuclease/phosphatase family metal-dependent hydrolase
MEFSIVNWNIGGAKYLEEKKAVRENTRAQINNGLRELIKRNRRPYVITLQEIVRYGLSSSDAQDIIDHIEGYRYYSFPLIDSHKLSSKSKWSKVRINGGWSHNSFFAQGNAVLFREDVPHFPVWDLSCSNRNASKGNRHFIEQVNIESGLYFGDRNTEPRAALVSHFIFNLDGANTKPQDVFVVNLHLTTLMMERVGIPEIDLLASKIRLNQLGIVFHGIVSRYNTWKEQGFPERNKPREKRAGEAFERHEPLWVLAGDYNFTEESEEFQTIQRMNFMDVIPKGMKGTGTKAKGASNPATLVVDYIFAGPKFISLDPHIIGRELDNNCVDHEIHGSDHYPCCAKIPFAHI